MHCHLVVFKFVYVLSLRTSVQARQNERTTCSQNAGKVAKITRLRLHIYDSTKKRLTFAVVLLLCLAENKHETVQ